MLKYVLTFTAGALAAVAVLVVVAAVPFHRTMAATATKIGEPTATVVIRISEDPNKLRLANDASVALEQISNLTDAERKKIRDGIASGLVTGIELRSETRGEYRSITIPAHSSGTLMRMSSSAHFGPAELHFDARNSPNPSETTRGK